jgi:hypothetical protein
MRRPVWPPFVPEGNVGPPRVPGAVALSGKPHRVRRALPLRSSSSAWCDEKTQAVAVADHPPALTRWIEWDDLSGCPHHPCSDEVRRYLAWKERHSLAI